jgi:hypothetical protein
MHAFVCAAGWIGSQCVLGHCWCLSSLLLSNATVDFRAALLHACIVSPLGFPSLSLFTMRVPHPVMCAFVDQLV